MRELSYHDLAASPRYRNILEATINLTYRCNLDCIHCFTAACRCRQLSPGAWKKIIDSIRRAGCFWLNLTGGEPLVYGGFLDLYRYAVSCGMKVTVLTNGTLCTSKVLEVFSKYRPAMVEVSLYGATSGTHDAITRTPGSYQRTIDVLRELAGRRIPALIKTVGLRQNRAEVFKVKSLSEQLLGKQRFKFDSLVFPRLNGDTGVLRYRLSPRQVLGLEAQDREMLGQRRKEARSRAPQARPGKYLYWCASWRSSFSIDPGGVLSFCGLSRHYRFDLSKVSFKEAFFKKTPLLHQELFSKGSRCRDCALRRYCYSCPARAYLETGDRQRGSRYYCQLARARKKQYEALAAAGEDRE